MKAPMHTVPTTSHWASRLVRTASGRGGSTASLAHSPPAASANVSLLQYLGVRVKNTSDSELLCRHGWNTGRTSGCLGGRAGRAVRAAAPDTAGGSPQTVAVRPAVDCP